MPIEMGDLLLFYINKSKELGPDKALAACYEQATFGDEEFFWFGYHVDLLRDVLSKMARQAP